MKKLKEIFKKCFNIIKHILRISAFISVYLFINGSFFFFVYLIGTWNILYTIKVALFLDSIFYPLIGVVLEFALEFKVPQMSIESIFFWIGFYWGCWFYLNYWYYLLNNFFQLIKYLLKKLKISD